MVGTSIVSKLGFSNWIPAEHKIGLAGALNFLGYTLKEIMKHYNVCVYNDDARNIQFSKELQKYLRNMEQTLHLHIVLQRKKQKI